MTTTRPETHSRPSEPRGRRTFWVLGVLLALLVAGVASYYASAMPDGLEYVAEKTGFADTAEDSATADSPFADYGTEGVGSDRLSVGIAGVVGCLLVLGLMSAIAYLVRRRRR